MLIVAILYHTRCWSGIEQRHNDSQTLTMSTGLSPYGLCTILERHCHCALLVILNFPQSLQDEEESHLTL